MSAETERVLLQDLRALRADALDDGFRARLAARLESANVYPLFDGDAAREARGERMEVPAASDVGDQPNATGSKQGRSLRLGRPARIGLLLVAAVFISGGAAALMGANPLRLLTGNDEAAAPAVFEAPPPEERKPAAPKLWVQPKPVVPPVELEPPAEDREEPTRALPAPLRVPKAPLDLRPEPASDAKGRRPRLNDGQPPRPLEVPRVEPEALDPTPQTQRPAAEEKPLAIPKLRPDLDSRTRPTSPRTRPRDNTERHKPPPSTPEAPRTRRPRRADPPATPDRERPRVRPRPDAERPERPSERLERTPERLRRR